MASRGHTFGPSCMLYTTSNTFTRRASAISIDAPKISAQFFYCSALPIDDPLSPVPPPSSNITNKPTQVPPRPFSVRDNIALESAWLRLQTSIISTHNLGKTQFVAESGKTPGQRTEIRGDGYEGGFAHQVVPESYPDSTDLTLSDGPVHIPLDQTIPVTSKEISEDRLKSGMLKPRSRSPFHRKDKGGEQNNGHNNTNGDEKQDGDSDLVSSRSSRKLSQSGLEISNDTGSTTNYADTSGKPFIRISPRTQNSNPEQQVSEMPPKVDFSQSDGAGVDDVDYRPKQPSPLRSRLQQSLASGHTEITDGSNLDRVSPKKDAQVHITVGFSRLHVVEMPSLKMGPIYWDPVHDISSVVRGTWFYKVSMCPVESDVANQIEAGYEYIKPWTPTYQDELDSCIDIGPEAEIKVAYKLWSSEDSQSTESRPNTAKSRQSEPLDSDEKARKQALKVAGLAPNKAAGILAGFETHARLYAKSSIVYANSRDAQILTPSQLPSAARGRKPLANIRKGRAVGIPVVRGFDVQAWEKLYPPAKKLAKVPQNEDVLRTIASTATQAPCIACQDAGKQPKPTDLILVIHGIGQKLSERVEAFHFTHAINAFRRQVNIELSSTEVKPWLRQDLGSVMVLPINWRSTLKLEDDGSASDPDQVDHINTRNNFNLKDITAESIPAVRNLISDVMLDIPYYLSHHKPKMIEAVIREANRIYRLWCTNNPGFQETGRVHLIAHSLGSVMALDILSHQPTKLPQALDLGTTSIPNDVFDFNTRNLFFCGSPAGFFLLLNHANLTPRREWEKPGADGDSAGVAGQDGSYGCLAVDNIYNIMAFNDPIAYRLNATVDVDYAASLKQAFVPSASLSWGQYFGSYFRGKAIAPGKTMTNLDNLPRRPTTARLPTTVEMETHDFSKEETAERRMSLLNDNGQIDYTMQQERGALEFQYLNMLKAHSSYWTRQDFVRFLVVEIGRTPGKTATVSSIKAVKKPFGKK